MNQHFRRICGFLIFFVFITELIGCMNIAREVREMTTDKIAYEIDVTDTQGHPISAATIWAIYPWHNPNVNEDFAKRLAARYGQDSDFIHNVEAPYPGLSVYYTNINGAETHSLSGKGDIPGPSVKTLYVALKRGYKPRIIENIARANSTQKLVLQLEPDPAAKFDIRLLQLDILRAEAYTTPSGGMMETSRLFRLRDVEKKLRLLARTFEGEGKLDEASAVFHTLAFLPSVDTVKNNDGSESIVGYTNGFSVSRPQRMADLAKAVDLNLETPSIALQKATEIMKNKNIQPRTIEGYRFLIALTETSAQKNPERLWPRSYLANFTRYILIGDLSKACLALQRAYRFEPLYHGADDWNELLMDYNKARNASKTTAPECKLELSK